MDDIYFLLPLNEVSFQIHFCLQYVSYKEIQVTIARRFHLFPFRTEKLSFVTPMVLLISGRVGSRRFSQGPQYR